MRSQLSDARLDEPPIQLAPREFEQIRQLAYNTFGLDLKPGKEELVSARLRRLVRDGGFRSFGSYYRSVITDTTGVSLAALIDALTTNHTSFMREPDHFTFLRSEILPRYTARTGVELWSAACATGEEVWSLAAILSETLPNRRHRISASDISQKALSTAEQAIYPRDRCLGVPPDWFGRHLVRSGHTPETWRVSAPLREMVSFRRLNLLQSYSWGRLFPIIFCRNVMIYFDRPTQERVVAQLTASLEPGGYLFVGHAESLTRVSHSLEYVRPAVYRKPDHRSVSWKTS